MPREHRSCTGVATSAWDHLLAGSPAVDLLELGNCSQAALGDPRAAPHHDALEARQRLQQQRAEAAVRDVRTPADGKVLQACGRAAASARLGFRVQP